MDWINLQVSLLRTPSYIGSKPVERATWLSVLAYCVEQENGGRVRGGALWKDRQWQQAMGVTSREVRAASKLIAIEGDDVVVAFYPTEKEKEVQAKRVSNTRAAVVRWERAKAQQPIPPDASRNASCIAPCSAEQEVGIEDNQNQNNSAGVLPFTLDPPKQSTARSGPPAKPTAPREVLFEALARAEGSDPDQLTKTGKRAIGVALAGILSATPDATPSEIANRAAAYRRLMPTATLTASALAKHWARCSGAPVSKRTSEPSNLPPPGWVEWLDQHMPASDDEGPRSQLTAAKNCQSFAMMPASWQARCRGDLGQPDPAPLHRGQFRDTNRHSRYREPLPAALNQF